MLFLVLSHGINLLCCSFLASVVFLWYSYEFLKNWWIKLVNKSNQRTLPGSIWTAEKTKKNWHVSFLCCSCVVPVLFLCCTRGIPVLLMFYSCVVPVFFMFYPCVSSVVLLCRSCVSSVVFLCHSCVASVLFLCPSSPLGSTNRHSSSASCAPNSLSLHNHATNTAQNASVYVYVYSVKTRDIIHTFDL